MLFYSALPPQPCLVISFNKFHPTAEVGTPPAPALVADSLTATSLALEWENPDTFTRFSGRGRVDRDPLESYLVQFRFEENVGDWMFCSNQSIGLNSTIIVEDLNPYTKYRVSGRRESVR